MQRAHVPQFLPNHQRVWRVERGLLRELAPSGSPACRPSPSRTSFSLGRSNWGRREAPSLYSETDFRSADFRARGSRPSACVRDGLVPVHHDVVRDLALPLVVLVDGVGSLPCPCLPELPGHLGQLLVVRVLVEGVRLSLRIWALLRRLEAGLTRVDDIARFASLGGRKKKWVIDVYCTAGSGALNKLILHESQSGSRLWISFKAASHHTPFSLSPEQSKAANISGQNFLLPQISYCVISTLSCINRILFFRSNERR